MHPNLLQLFPLENLYFRTNLMLMCNCLFNEDIFDALLHCILLRMLNVITLRRAEPREFKRLVGSLGSWTGQYGSILLGLALGNL